MRIVALWMVSFFVAVLLAVESLVAVQCDTTPTLITGVGFTETGNSVVVRIDGQVEHWGGPFDRATYFYTNGHTDAIDGIAYSPDGKLLASASEDQTVRLWDAETGHYLRTLFANYPQVAVAFMPDSKYLVSVGMNGTWIVWDASSGTKVKDTYNYALVGTAALSPDGRFLAKGISTGDMNVAEVATGRVIANIHIPRLVDGELSYPPHVQQIAIAPDGKTALVVNTNTDKSVYMFETQTWRLVDKFAADRPGCAAFSPDGQVAIICDFNMLTVWNLEQHEIVSRFPIAATNLVFSKDGKTFWTIDWVPSLNEYDFHAGTRLQQIPLYFQLSALGRYPWRPALTISPDGTRIAASLHNGRISIFDTRTGQRQQVLFGHASSVLGGQVVGNNLLTYSDDRTAILWDIATGTLINRIEGQWGPVTVAALSPDKRYLIAASGARYGEEVGTAKLWDVQTGQMLQTLEHGPAVSTISFSANSQYAFIGTNTGSVHVWNIPDGKWLDVMDITNSAINSIGVDKDTLFTSSDTYIIKMEYSPGREQARQRAFIGNNTSLLKLVTASGAHWFATIESNQIRLWDKETLTPIRVLSDQSASAAAFSADGNTILIGDVSGAPRLVDARTGSTLRILCPHPLTRRWLVVSGLLFVLLGLRIVSSIILVIRQKPPSAAVSP